MDSNIRLFYVLVISCIIYQHVSTLKKHKKHLDFSAVRLKKSQNVTKALLAKMRALQNMVLIFADNVRFPHILVDNFAFLALVKNAKNDLNYLKHLYFKSSFLNVFK